MIQYRKLKNQDKFSSFQRAKIVGKLEKIKGNNKNNNKLNKGWCDEIRRNPSDEGARDKCCG